MPKPTLEDLLSSQPHYSHFDNPSGFTEPEPEEVVTPRPPRTDKTKYKPVPAKPEVEDDDEGGIIISPPSAPNNSSPPAFIVTPPVAEAVTDVEEDIQDGVVLGLDDDDCVPGVGVSEEDDSKEEEEDLEDDDFDGDGFGDDEEEEE